MGEHDCVMCKTRGKPWKGSDPKCAFTDGRFNRDNWNCATMNKLREIADANGLSDRDDMAAGSFGAVPFEGDDYSGYIVMTWYKSRGKTGNALVMWDDEPVRELTEADAREAIAQFERERLRS